MNYLGTHYTFSPKRGVHVAHQEPIHYPPHTSLAQHIESYYPGRSHSDLADFGHRGPMPDDFFEDGAEASTRPRLTKEQVDVLESQFQAQAKPNSNLKRQLAVQTKLTLPRVANWFQNRRAKAKQQKKQEEFEFKRAMGMADGWKSDSNLPAGYPTSHHLNTAEPSDNLDGTQKPTKPSSANPASGRNSTQDAGWASLQRALSAATAAQNQLTLELESDQSFTSMPAPPMPPPEQAVPTSTTSYSNWTPRATTSICPLSPSEESLPFDFDFSQPAHSYSSGASQSQDSPEAVSVPGFAMPADVWPTGGRTPTVPTHPTIQQFDHGKPTFPSTLPVDVILPTTFSPQIDTTFQLPQYPVSRRGSASDELTSNFGTFAVSTPPMPSPLRTTSDIDSFRRNKDDVDLAARRKRPRPPPLGSAALRSRSYGAPPSMSPTLRLGNHSPHPYPVRHVKSMGQNLNIRYSGIRKPSSAQRSPLNVATFAEADAFRELLQSQPGTVESHSGTTPPTPISSDDFVARQLPIHEDGFYLDQGQHTPYQFCFSGQALNFNMASPPSTPLNLECYPPHLQTSMPPLSAPPQYAFFTDHTHTPPYSAGPLTSGSLQEAPFTSAEMYQMPQVMYPTAQDFSNGVFQNFPVPPQPKAEATFVSTEEQKPTEFFIQEFPRQKEEHARAAQHLAQQKPKNYVFANATPNDF